MEVEYHRALSEIEPWLILTGDLPFNETEALEKLDEWVKSGVTHVMDVRKECSDERFVREHAPHIKYFYFPTDDAGQKMTNEWFDKGVKVALDLKPGEKLLVHCHMGINRAPSMVFRILLEYGYSTLEALARIKSVRPIAGILYAHDAVEHFLQERGESGTTIDTEVEKVYDWYNSNRLDLHNAIRALRMAGE